MIPLLIARVQHTQCPRRSSDTYMRHKMCTRTAKEPLHTTAWSRGPRYVREDTSLHYHLRQH
ncbi:hypothetical protein PISMIDRAFT_476596 [Pisolithus microcarpus 441]|uniref:Uncharacterized protein n=1 Tax=Pisolithus microcarpus 441 TaxID=765257 RepID=A0A0C9YUY0_9AGAM|nr:hypothetical protein PISMIDRAFT_476596 [Pisolithus microcarpus 441]